MQSRFECVYMFHITIGLSISHHKEKKKSNRSIYTLRYPISNSFECAGTVQKDIVYIMFYLDTKMNGFVWTGL